MSGNYRVIVLIKSSSGNYVFLCGKQVCRLVDHLSGSFQELNELVDLGFRLVLNQGDQFSVSRQEYLGKTINARSVDSEGSQVSLAGTTLNPAIANKSS